MPMTDDDHSAPPDGAPYRALPAADEDTAQALAAARDDAEMSRQEQAFALYCQGERTAAIAARLDVTPRTVRGWLAAARARIASDRAHDHRERLLLAIESHRAIASEAWEAYQQERQLERDLLAGKYDHIQRRSVRRVRGRGVQDMARDGADAGDASTDDDDTLVEEYARPRHTSQAVRFLAVALNAQREVARLEGLYRQVAEPLPPAQIIITRRPDGPENVPPPEEE
jgi:transposase